MVGNQLVAISAAGGGTTPIGATGWPGAFDLAWLGDGSGVVVAGQPREADESSLRRQVWFVSYPDGRLTRLTNDSSDYLRLTSAGDGRSLVAQQSRYVTRLFVAPSDDLAQAREVRGGVAADESFSSPSASDDAVLVSRFVGRSVAVWITAQDGAGRRSRPITSINDDTVGSFDWSSDGRHLYYVRHRSLSQDVVLLTDVRPDAKAP